MTVDLVIGRCCENRVLGVVNGVLCQVQLTWSGRNRVEHAFTTELVGTSYKVLVPGTKEGFRAHWNRGGLHVTTGSYIAGPVVYIVKYYYRYDRKVIFYPSFVPTVLVAWYHITTCKSCSFLPGSKGRCY